MSRIALLLFALAPLAWAAELPPPVSRPVDFQKDIAPLFETSCVKCHAKGREKGGFSIETRTSFLKGGESGEAAKLGRSKESLIVEMVAGVDPDNVMPKKGTRWTPEQVGLLRAWIDQGAVWPD
jgi:mono/diheme cytochrome c family protein